MTGKWIIAGALVVSLLFAAVALANGPPGIDWWVMGGGGGGASAGSHRLDSTVGQAVVGAAGHGGLELCAGFWCRAAARYKTYLPLILRNYP